MIGTIINGILNLASFMIEIFLWPIDRLLQQLVPSTTTAFTYITSFFNMISIYTRFVISYLGFLPEVISICILLIIPIITIPLSVHSIKLILAWWRTLKL